MFWKITKGIVASWVLLAATSAQAQDIEEFKTLMADAAAMTKVDMTEALRQYLEIRVRYAGPEVDYSVGRIYQRLNQCTEAQRYYTQVMVAYDLAEDNPIYKRSVDAYDKIAQCESWQRVKITCEIPPQGYVTIDGERLSTCWDRAYAFSDGEHEFVLYDAKGNKVEKKITTKTGNEPQNVHLAFPPKKVEVERVVEVERTFVEKERFHPALYWGLIAGGAAVVAVGGFLSGAAGSARVDEQYYADLVEVYSMKNSANDELADKYDKKRKDANDKVKAMNIATYTLVGIGGAMAVSGAVLAILNALSDRERVEVTSDVNAYVAPSVDGVSLGFSMNF